MISRGSLWLFFYPLLLWSASNANEFGTLFPRWAFSIAENAVKKCHFISVGIEYVSYSHWNYQNGKLNLFLAYDPSLIYSPSSCIVAREFDTSCFNETSFVQNQGEKKGVTFECWIRSDNYDIDANYSPQENNNIWDELMMGFTGKKCTRANGKKKISLPPSKSESHTKSIEISGHVDKEEEKLIYASPG